MSGDSTICDSGALRDLRGPHRPASRPDNVNLPANIHATAIVIGETGVLIRGASGAGKSALALALIEAARQAGRHGRLICDDRVLLSECGGRLIAAVHPRIAGLIERRGDGLVRMPYEPRAVLHCVMDLVEIPGVCGDLPRLPGESELRTTFGCVHLPVISLVAQRFSLHDLLRAMDFVGGCKAVSVK